MENIKRVVVKPGYIYEVQINDREKCYFQNLGNDYQALGANAIRVFKTKYSLDAKPTAIEIVTDEVRLYIHIFIRAAVKEGYCVKVGKSNDLGLDDLMKVDFYGGYVGRKQGINKKEVEEWMVYKFGTLWQEKIANPQHGDKYIEDGTVVSILSVIDWLNAGHWNYNRFNWMRAHPLVTSDDQIATWGDEWVRDPDNTLR